MMQIAVVIIFFVVTECKINKDDKTKDDLEYWKPEPNFSEKPVRLRKIITKNPKPVFRHNDVKLKKQENKTKWPKILRQFTTSSLLQPRSTKMHMMQEGEETTLLTEKPLQETPEKSNEYLSSYSIRQQLERIIKNIPNSNVTLEVIGRTIEYQDIVLLKITESRQESEKYFRADDEKYADDKPEKKIIFIVHGLSVMGVKDLPCLSWERDFLKLVSYYTNHLNKFDIFLIPMANPDGYALIQPPYDYFWNKNASPQTECPGVALDRNFDVAWRNNHSLGSCSQEYSGNAPFSEAETRAIREIFHKYSHKIVAFLNVHGGTYDSATFKGDAILYPKGYTDSVTDEDKYTDLKGEIDEVIRNASFQVFSVAVDTLHNWYGRVTGSSVDYASSVYGIPFALEFVMQLYNNDKLPESSETYTEIALNVVWSRVIDVTLKFIWKVLNKGNEI